MDRKKPGPEPDRVKVTGDWEAAIGDAMKKSPPPGGWPTPAPMPQRAKKGTGKNKGRGGKPKP